MHRNELKTIAEGLKRARPAFTGNVITIEGQPSGHQVWGDAVRYVAEALKLEGKSLSNFYAACGLIHSQG